ncbi:LacI family transcriptional regulator [Kribbella amoyensis]|uniref:LacI family transcriptional regulator n=1 Tax=Kribbella amoyensis TaxID=996641 RepID=A0A561BYF4_9ACTN|nr:LacI family DNA-binding transcriptional regulator [Kribbella amoyensis]TWD83841.1 LacI family transcriptional regulator [Kribbella amoyensis]
MAVTIRDVAKAAGVSPSTVSRALSLPDMVDPATRERVLRVADHLGYRPNRAARGLITGRTGNLGLILPDLANPFFPSVVKGIQHQAHQADYQVFVADSDEDPGAELGLVRSLAKQVDGLILCSPRMRPAELREAATFAAPVVLVNRKEGSIPAIAIANAAGMRLIVDHLAGLGHHRIGFVAGPRSSWSGRERLRGLRVAATATGTELVELGHFPPTFEGGVDAAEGALISGVTAVVAYNDLTAFGLLSALRARGVDVPGQLSVVGIDDIQMATMVHPPLTTLNIPKERTGRASVDLLLHLLGERADIPDRVREMPTELVVRETTGPINSTSQQSARRTPRR